MDRKLEVLSSKKDLRLIRPAISACPISDVLSRGGGET